MKIVSEREQIRDVAERWKSQYFHNGVWGSCVSNNAAEIYRGLAALTDAATAADVARIIGNTSWIGEKCNECGSPDAAVVRVGEEPDYESSTAYLCRKCLGAIVAAVLEVV